MRCTTLKAPSAEHLDRLVGYYAGLPEDHRRRDGRARGPVETRGRPSRPAGRARGAARVVLGTLRQVEVRLGEVLRRWVDEHDGAEPDARTVAALERDAVLKSRPNKPHVTDAEVLRADWQLQALDAGYDLPVVPSGRRPLPGLAGLDREEVIDEALRRVAEGASSWLQGDLMREVSTLVPADAAPSAEALVALVDELATEAAVRCTELHPPDPAGTPCRSDGRPVTEAVTDHQLSSPPVLDQERRLLEWAERQVHRGGEPSRLVGGEALDDEQAAGAAAAAGTAAAVLVVGPAGTGKTRTLTATVASLRARGQAVLGVAPSGKAADVLTAEAGCPSVTLAKLLLEHDHYEPSPALQLPPGSTVLLDEAGMASTKDLDRLVTLANRMQWRLVFVGDPEQLPAVGRGGMFAAWCEHGVPLAEPPQQPEELRRRRLVPPRRPPVGLGL